MLRPPGIPPLPGKDRLEGEAFLALIQEAICTSFLDLDSTSFIEAGSVSLKDITARIT